MNYKLLALRFQSRQYSQEKDAQILHVLSDINAPLRFYRLSNEPKHKKNLHEIRFFGKT